MKTDSQAQESAQFLADNGLPRGTGLENITAHFFERFGFSGRYVREFPVGRYRADFAFPEIRLVVEADGVFHFTPQGMDRDALRDSEFRRQGWMVMRLDDNHGNFADQVICLAFLLRQLLAPGSAAVAFVSALNSMPVRDATPSASPAVIKAARLGLLARERGIDVTGDHNRIASQLLGGPRGGEDPMLCAEAGKVLGRSVILHRTVANLVRDHRGAFDSSVAATSHLVES